MSERVDFSKHDTTGQLAEHSRQTLDEAKKAADEAVGDYTESDAEPTSERHPEDAAPPA